MPDCRSAHRPDEYSHLFTFLPISGSSLLVLTLKAAVPAYARLITAQLDVEPMTVLDDEPSSRSTARRPLGFAAVALALTSLLIGSVVLRPGIAGQAAVDPRLMLPAPGACILEESAPIIVDCALPHHAEITASWWAGEQGAPIIDPTRPAAPIGGSDCYREAAVALGTDRTDSTWLPIEPVVTARLVQAAPIANGQGWTACLVAPPDGRLFTGSTKAPATNSWPDPFARCLTTGAELVAVDCDSPHDVEIFGRFNPVGGPESRRPHRENPELLAECIDLVRDKVGTTDPTFGGVLAVRAQPLLPGWRYEVVESDAGGRRTLVSYLTPFCFVETVSGELTATLTARGDRPPPIR
jgi:hypothetical protein